MYFGPQFAFAQNQKGLIEFGQPEGRGRWPAVRSAGSAETALFVLFAERGVDGQPTFVDAAWIVPNDGADHVVHGPALELGAFEAAAVMPGQTVSVGPRPAGVAQQVGRHFFEQF